MKLTEQEKARNLLVKKQAANSTSNVTPAQVSTLAECLTSLGRDHNGNIVPGLAGATTAKGTTTIAVDKKRGGSTGGATANAKGKGNKAGKGGNNDDDDDEVVTKEKDKKRQNDENEQDWVQCDTCSKWRKLPMKSSNLHCWFETPLLFAGGEEGRGLWDCGSSMIAA